MPRRTRKQHFRPGQLVVAKQAFGIDINGVAYTFTSKQNVSADHVVVQEYPDYFKAVDPVANAQPDAA